MREVDGLGSRVSWGQPARVAEALEALLEENHARLLAWIQRRLGRSLRPHLEAGDVLQVTLMRAFRRIGQFRGNSRESLLSWLTSIAKNVVRDEVDYLLRQRRCIHKTVSLRLPGPEPSSAGGRIMGTKRLFGAFLTAATLWARAASAQVDTIAINALTCNPLPASEAKLSRTVTGWRFLGSAVGSVGPTSRWEDFSHSYDLYDSSYYVRVIMSRTVATQNPEFRAVRLTYIIY